MLAACVKHNKVPVLGGDKKNTKRKNKQAEKKEG
jgi:hypothetical protein